MTTLKRVSISMPIELADDLDYISKRLGVSRSGLVSQMLLAGDIHQLRVLLGHIPEEPTEGDLKRFRGDSKAYIEDALSRLQSMQGVLFDDSSN